MGLFGKQRLLNLPHVGCLADEALVPTPVLHHHRDAGGATAVLRLFDEGNVNPVPARLRNGLLRPSTSGHRDAQKDCLVYQRASVGDDDNQDKHNDREHDEGDIARA